MGLCCILPGLRVVVMGNRHGWSIVHLWWFHPVHCFPITHPCHSPPSLLVISLSSPCCFLVVSPSLPVVVSPLFLIIVSPVVPSFFILIVPHCWLLGCLSLSTQHVCHIHPLFPVSYCLWHSCVELAPTVHSGR